MRTLALCLALSLPLFACGGAPANGSSGGATAADANLKAPGEAKMGDKTRCPISGETFTVSESSPKTEVDGKTYYFCCSGCSEKFKADPKKYLNKT
jgi:Cu+-exporting ATPase